MEQPGHYRRCHGRLADVGSGVVSCTLADGDHIFYVDVNQHLNQLFYNATTGAWVNTDLTVASFASVAILHSSLTVMPLSDGDHIFYIDSNQHIDQIWNSGSSWTR